MQSVVCKSRTSRKASTYHGLNIAGADGGKDAGRDDCCSARCAFAASDPDTVIRIVTTTPATAASTATRLRMHTISHAAGVSRGAVETGLSWFRSLYCDAVRLPSPVKLEQAQSNCRHYSNGQQHCLPPVQYVKFVGDARLCGHHLLLGLSEMKVIVFAPTELPSHRNNDRVCSEDRNPNCKKHGRHRVRWPAPSPVADAEGSPSGLAHRRP